MAVNIIKRTWHQNQMVKIEPLNGFAFQAESGGHTFQISGVDDSGNAVPISGTIAGVFLRPDNADVALTGSASGGVASVTLTAECYAVPGRFLLTVYATSGSNKGTIYAAMGTVSRTSSGAVSPAAASDVVDLVNRINAATATIPASYTTLLNAVATDYSPDATYPKVGTFVWYSGKLYRSKVPITTAETWTAAHWNQVVLSDALNQDITDLKSAVNQNTLYGNLLGYGKTSYGKAIAPSGSETWKAAFDTTDFIPVSEGELLYSNITTRYAFYDSKKALVSTANFSARPLLFSEVSDVRYVIVPTGAIYFRICYSKDLANSCFLCRPNIYDNVYGQEIEKLKISAKTNFWNYGTVLDNTYVTLSGSTGGNEIYKTTDFIPVTPGTIVYGYGARFYCYDENKTAISGTTGVLNLYGEALSNGMHYYKIPEEAVFFRICANKTITEHDDFQIYSTDIFETILHEAEPVPEPVNTRKLYTLGDSITRGMYAEQGASSSSGPTPQGYPYWVGQVAGYEVVNLGNSGSGWANVGSAETAGDPSTARNAKDVVDDNTFSDADIITMAWGVNDWKGASQNVVLGDMNSVSGDGTVIGNMKYCIETLMTKKPTAQLIVLLPMNTNRQWSGMQKMTLAENWAFGYPYRNNQTLEDYRNAIRQCAEYYNVKVIDLEEVCPINRLNLRNMCGDGLHPTKAFHKQMGLALAPLIN